MTKDSALRFIRCWASERTYALDMEWVRSIQRIDQLQRSPGERGEIGWLRTAGMAVPVWALAERLGTAVHEDGASQRVIVLNDAVRPWGILVDRVSQVTAVTPSHSFPMPDLAINREKPYFSGVLLWQDKLLLRLAPDVLHPDAAITPLLDVAPPTNGKVDVRAENGRLSTDKTGQIVVFKLPIRSQENGDLSFALSITQVPEVLDPMPTIPIPNAPSYVQGLINWRNRPVTAIDMGGWLGLTDKMEKHGRLRLMIARTMESDTLIGFLTRPSIQILRLPLPHQPAGDSLPLDGKLLRGVVKSKGDTIVIPAI